MQLPVNRPPVSEIVIFIANNYDKAFLNILRSLELLKGPKELSEMEYDVKEHLEAAIQVLRGTVHNFIRAHGLLCWLRAPRSTCTPLCRCSNCWFIGQGPCHSQ